MPLHYEGDFEVPASKEKVFDFLTDPKRVGTLIPDVESIEVIDENNFNVKAKVGISFIKGTISFRLKVVEKEPPTYAKLVGKGTGLSSYVDVETSFSLEDKQGRGTVVKWAVDANIGGLIAGVGSRLLGSTAEKVIKQVIAGLQEKLRAG
jgi:carbon monoxide dehydrogenase subunit G